jgi:hypothetical protein
MIIDKDGKTRLLETKDIFGGKTPLQKTGILLWLVILVPLLIIWQIFSRSQRPRWECIPQFKLFTQVESIVRWKINPGFYTHLFV